MGLCLSDEAKKDRRISQAMKKKGHSVFKILLLGPGESGKSTIFKQVRLIYDGGFKTSQEREAFKPTIHANVVEGIKQLIAAAEKSEQSMSPTSMRYAATILALNLNDHLTPEIGRAVKAVWADPAIKQAFKKKSQLQLGDSVAYMLENVERLSEPDYIPSQEDVIRSRVRTSGIIEQTVDINGVAFKIVDVGGQRGERRKWVHCFQSVQAVVYVTAISEYDQVLQEDETQNRLVEALSLFTSICNVPTFKSTSMIIFLNKSDIFYDKLANKVGNLNSAFPDYDGGYDPKVAIQFIIQKFANAQADKTKELYFHVTCATNTDNISFVFTAVQDMVIKQNLGECNLF